MPETTSRTALQIAGVLGVTVGFVATLGLPGLPVSVALVLLWQFFPAPYAYAFAHVVLAARFDQAREPVILLLFEVALLAVLAGWSTRFGRTRFERVLVVAVALALGAVVWGTYAVTASRWFVVAVLVAVMALVVYSLRLRVLDLARPVNHER